MPRSAAEIGLCVWSGPSGGHSDNDEDGGMVRDDGGPVRDDGGLLERWCEGDVTCQLV
jgi:hypothetical protein